MIISVRKLLNEYENRVGLTLKPDKRFYTKVGINQKRFGQLLRGEKPIYVYEALNLCSFFGITLEDLLQKEIPTTTGNSVGTKISIN